MNWMTVSGRRGEITWKATLLRRELTYDTWLVQFGLIVPFILGDAIHIWDIPLTSGGRCKAIRLRPDSDFRRRVLTGSWVGLAAMLGCAALLFGSLWLLTQLLFAPAAAAFAGSVAIGGIGIWLTRRPATEARHRAIRLLLGLHEWGGSDPATWSEELVAKAVNPKAAFGVESYAALSERERMAKRWGEAMWAARLCAATEDVAKGEELSDAILNEPEVAGRLRKVRRRPRYRDEGLGSTPGLRKWVNCDPSEHILLIG